MTQTSIIHVGELGFDIPSGKEMYDLLMARIEPELLSENIPLLAQRYAKETPQQHEERMARYSQAYAKYDAAYAQWLTLLNAAVYECKHEAFSVAERKNRVVEEKEVSRLESLLTANSPS